MDGQIEACEWYLKGFEMQSQQGGVACNITVFRFECTQKSKLISSQLTPSQLLEFAHTCTDTKAAAAVAATASVSQITSEVESVRVKLRTPSSVHRFSISTKCHFASFCRHLRLLTRIKYGRDHT